MWLSAVQNSKEVRSLTNWHSKIGRIYCLFWVEFTAHFGTQILIKGRLYGTLHHKNKTMAKEIEKKSARILFIEQGKSSEEIALQLGVNKRTVDRWATEGEWRKIRDAKANSGKERIERTQLVVDSLTDRRLQVIEQIKENEAELKTADKERKTTLQRELLDLRKECATIDDAIAKWNKRIENLIKGTKITLSMYIEVMESIFEALRLKDEKLYMLTLDFQEEHLHEVADKKF